MRLILVAGSTATAEIDGISAAGADDDLLVHTPGADAELLTYGDVVRAPEMPTSPSGCPTPALVTRAARELVGFDVVAVDGGLRVPTGAPTVTVGARPGDDIRERDPVPSAPGSFEAARQYGRKLPDEEVVLGETVPGGTTTALGVLRALGEEWSVSSSLPENPLTLKEEVVADGLEASGLRPGDAANEPKTAVRRVGDPVLAVVSGLTVGALESGTRVVLGGGTQMIAAAALVRHAGVEAPLSLATTAYVADSVPDLRVAAAELDLGLTVSDPGFDAVDHTGLSGYAAGVAKEGAGMGGALALADRAGVLNDVAATTLESIARLSAHNGP
ncbi:TIGR00303 family protein [Halogranum amylolyticum]|uniref:UPF0284 protein SAMN04487948_12178 n=1 Tax=Halogranum amylolyticum TaxID=660520 RepID=A0A1H8W060_9EURY|nr:nicotinate-nucleotide--dimethylbenzimidazole phosphoribosyltransferase [Halogranum amylolyticum]SEP20980.1 TIGR00303 family protein [Halogranum amylolyticum]